MARSIRTEGVSSWSSAVRTAVGIYNQQAHSATGVPPNRLFLGRDLHLPGDVFRGDPLPSGSLVGGPGTIAARIQDDISVLREVALAGSGQNIPDPTGSGFTQNLTLAP